MIVRDRSVASVTFDVINHIFLTALAITCLLPLVHMFAVSLSARGPAAAGLVTFWPIDPHLAAYRYIIESHLFLNSFRVSIMRVIVGVVVQMGLVILTAYPLTREPEELPGRNLIMWFFFFTMLFEGGLIPTFLLVRNLGLIDNFFALILPVALPVFSMIIMMNFFRSLPKSLYESAMMDGATHWTIMARIYVPLSKPSIATLSLFSMVFHWNEWFMGSIYLNDYYKWPLQTYLRQLLANIDFSRVTAHDIEALRQISDRTFLSAQLFVATIPIVLVYPFLQKYFVKGIVLGSVKE